MNEKPVRHRPPNDPLRRKRIIDAALVAIKQYGVSAVTHRRIAEIAEVPLGSLTYYFSGLDQIIGEAFKALASTVLSRFSTLLEQAVDTAHARAAIVDFLTSEHKQDQAELLAVFELYAGSIRHSELRSVVTDWMTGSRAAMERHFSPRQARALDALIEGVMIHNLANPGLISRDEIAEIIDRLTA